MKFCTECGTKLQDGLRFCTECGTPIAADSAEEVSDVAADEGGTKPAGDGAASETVSGDAGAGDVSKTVSGTSADAASDTNSGSGKAAPPQPVKRAHAKSPPRKPMKKLTKILIGVAAVLALVLFGAHQYVSSLFDPVKSLQEMDQAMNGNNMEEFLSYIHFDDKAILDRESYFAYIQEEEWDNVKDQLLTYFQEQESVKHSFSKKITTDGGDALFTVDKQKKFVLYSTYIIRATPTKLVIHANMADTDLAIQKHTAKLADEDAKETVLIYPGEYTLTGAAKNLFGTFSYEDELVVYPGEQIEQGVNFSGETIPIDTDQANAILFINGESTGKTLGELEYIGPIPEGADMEMYAEWEGPDGKKIQTEKLSLNDTDWYGYSFYFESEDDVDTDDGDEAEDVDVEDADDADSKVASAKIDGDPGDIVLNFRDDYEAALNNKDFDLITPYLKDGSTAYKELKVYIGDLKDTKYHYDFEQNTVLHVDVVNEDKLEITTNEIFTFTNHKNETINYDREKIYTLVWADDAYQITHIDYVETNRDY